MNWQQIASLDAYLSGSLACRGWQWWDDTTAESQAKSVGLTGEQRAAFLRGWHDELAEQEQERKQQLVKEYDEMAEGYLKGDPATR